MQISTRVGVVQAMIVSSAAVVRGPYAKRPGHAFKGNGGSMAGASRPSGPQSLSMPVSLIDLGPLVALGAIEGVEVLGGADHRREALGRQRLLHFRRFQRLVVGVLDLVDDLLAACRPARSGRSTAARRSPDSRPRRWSAGPGTPRSRLAPVVASPISRPSCTNCCTGAMLENITLIWPEIRSFTVSPPPR